MSFSRRFTIKKNSPRLRMKHAKVTSSGALSVKYQTTEFGLVLCSFRKKNLKRAVDRNKLKRLIAEKYRIYRPTHLSKLNLIFFLKKPVSIDEAKSQIPLIFNKLTKLIDRSS